MTLKVNSDHAQLRTVVKTFSCAIEASILARQRTGKINVLTKAKLSKTKLNKTGVGTCHQGPFRVAACWPHQEAPLVMCMLGEGKFTIATSFTPVSLDSILERSIHDLRDEKCEPSVASDLPAWIFAVPYETFPQTDVSTTMERPIAWHIKAALIWDEGKTEPRYLCKADAKSSRFHLDPAKELKVLLAEAQKWQPTEPEAIELLPVKSDESYLESVQATISSIRNGEFYQVNLLRFFHATKAGGWENLCMRMERFSGPFGCILTQGSRVIASFSPERFIETSHVNGKIKIETWPIKGSAARDLNDPIEDQKSGLLLQKSEKDLAELRMIIDLMRNDLTQICESGSVQVVSSDQLKKFSNIWHLEGHVTGVLRSELTLKDLLSSVCPGGSITGAPKLAAMERIRSDEGQSRGFFMGNLFTIMNDGTIKSNILIRTLTSDNWMRSARYAAGSGIVIKSDPEKELLEISTKCAVINGPHRQGKADV